MKALSRFCWRAFAWTVVTYMIACGGISGLIVCFCLMLMCGMLEEAYGGWGSATVVSVLLGLSVLAGGTIGTLFGLHITRPVRRALTDIQRQSGRSGDRGVDA